MQSSEAALRNRSLPVWAKTGFSGLRAEGIERGRVSDAPN